MPDHLRWAVATPLLLLFVWAASFHLWVLALICRNLLTGRRERVPSFVPLVGGLSGMLGLYLCPAGVVRGYEWLPLLLDAGSVLFLPVVLHALYRWWVERLQARGGNL